MDAILACILAAAAAQAEPANEVLRRIPVKASQGVAVDARHFYAISNVKVVKGDKETGESVATWQADPKNPAQAHFKHLNSGTVVDGRLYAAHSRYPVDPDDNTVEVWDVRDRKLEHERTIRMPREHGSLTWIDRRADGTWWVCYAVYGRGKNGGTSLVRYRREGDRFVEEKNWTFPEEVVREWGNFSCSGGSWGPDGLLYTTGHDHARAYVLRLDASDALVYLRTETGVGFLGQAIAWDRSSDRPVLWGIVKGKEITLTLVSPKPRRR